MRCAWQGVELGIVLPCRLVDLRRITGELVPKAVEIDAHPRGRNHDQKSRFSAGFEICPLNQNNQTGHGTVTCGPLGVTSLMERGRRRAEHPEDFATSVMIHRQNTSSLAK